MTGGKYAQGYAWAVRAVAPEPGTILLLGTGLAGLFGFRKKFKIQ